MKKKSIRQKHKEECLQLVRDLVGQEKQTSKYYTDKKLAEALLRRGMWVTEAIISHIRVVNEIPSSGSRKILDYKELHKVAPSEVDTTPIWTEKDQATLDAKKKA